MVFRFALGGEDFSGAGGVVDVDLQIFSNVDGFASAEIFTTTCPKQTNNEKSDPVRGTSFVSQT
jgi:hypothetical protein